MSDDVLQQLETDETRDQVVDGIRADSRRLFAHTADLLLKYRNPDTGKFPDIDDDLIERVRRDDPELVDAIASLDRFAKALKGL